MLNIHTYIHKNTFTNANYLVIETLTFVRIVH